MLNLNVPAELLNLLAPMQVWLSAIATIGIFSLLYKENPFYRVCEYTYVGCSAAHAFVTSFANTIKPGIETQMIQNGDWWEIIPIALGLLIYCQPFKKVAWLARFPMAFWVGYNAGYALTLRTAMPLLTQVRQTMMPIIVMSEGSLDIFGSINNIIFCACVIMVLLYFLFAVDVLRGRGGFILKASRLVIMVAFGAGFGNGVATRVSLLIGRLDFLFSEWMGLY